MRTSQIRKKLVDYLQIADEKKIKAIYTMVCDDINTDANDWDDDFVSTLDKRRQTFLDGTAPMYTWEETKKAAIEKVKSSK